MSSSSKVNSALDFKEYTKCKTACGILGFVRFLEGYYLIMITAKKKVAKIGHHDIYQIKDMQMIRLFKKIYTMKQNDEEKYVEEFKKINIGEGFYFSYTYDLTHTLQNNILKQIKKTNKPSGDTNEGDQNA